LAIVEEITIDGKKTTDFEKTSLYPGYQVKTGSGVEVMVRYGTGATNLVRENTQWEVQTREVASPPFQEVLGRLFKEIGKFYWPAGYEGSKKFEVSTERANTSIKGTTFTVSKIFDVTTVAVEEGVVEVTDLETQAVSKVAANEEISLGDNCLAIGDDLSIFFPCAEYNDVGYSFTLTYFPNLDDPTNLYWKMDLSTFATVMETVCIPVGGDLTIDIPCGEYAGAQYKFELDFVRLPADPAGLYWKIDLSTLQVVRRAVSAAAQ